MSVAPRGGEFEPMSVAPRGGEVVPPRVAPGGEVVLTGVAPRGGDAPRGGAPTYAPGKLLAALNAFMERKSREETSKKRKLEQDKDSPRKKPNRGTK